MQSIMQGNHTGNVVIQYIKPLLNVFSFVNGVATVV